MTLGKAPSSITTVYLGPVVESLSFASAGYTFEPPGDEQALVTWQAAARAAHLVAALSAGMSRTVELAQASHPVYGPIQPDGSAEVSTERFRAYLVITNGVPARQHGPMRPGRSVLRTTRLGAAVELVSAVTGVNVTGYLSGGPPTREPIG